MQVISGKRGSGQNSDQPPQPKIIYSVDCEKLQVFRYRREVAADGQQYARFGVRSQQVWKSCPHALKSLW